MMLDKTDASLSSALETGPSSADSNFNRPEPANLSQLGLERRVEIIPISQLTPYKGNARTHSRKQIRQIADSISRFGFVNPILIDDAGEIIAGHGRVEAAASGPASCAPPRPGSLAACMPASRQTFAPQEFWELPCSIRP